MKSRIGSLIAMSLAAVAIVAFWFSSAFAGGRDADHRFRVTSSTFTNGATTLPLSMIYPNSLCTSTGEVGGDISPELSWKNAPRGTRSFVVVTYDVTASFTHWGMYNISGDATGLPANAGVSGSSHGQQVSNDFGDLSYDGPCPPTSLTPLAHKYVFTVYALNVSLPTIPTYGDFQPGSEALYHALLKAARENHILASASIFALYSAAAPPGD
jgi:Raf kinase inhibitor-like YbhB/YbcL family protein